MDAIDVDFVYSHLVTAVAASPDLPFGSTRLI